MQCSVGDEGHPQWASGQRCPHILSPTLWPACPIIPSPRGPLSASGVPLGKPREGTSPLSQPRPCAGPAESDCSSGPPGPTSAPLVSGVCAQ